MYKKIIINAAEHETRVALLEDGNIAELFIERGDVSDIAGNIYKGKVQRVLRACRPLLWILDLSRLLLYM